MNVFFFFLFELEAKFPTVIVILVFFFFMNHNDEEKATKKPRKSSKKGKKGKKSKGLGLEPINAVHIDENKNWIIDKNVDPSTIFQFVKVIGEGGFGTVRLIKHIPSGLEMAGKSISPQILTDNKAKVSLAKEIKMMREIHSNYTIKYYGTVLLQDKLTILMEYCKLGSIRDLIDFRNQVLTEQQTCLVLHDLLHALDILHNQNKIIHRDIKAANILLDSNGYSKLTDFGVSRQFDKFTTIRSMVTVSKVGTPYWMAPEVINQDAYSVEADVWSVAATAVEIAEGAPPYCEQPPFVALDLIATRGFPGMRYKSHFTKDFVDFVNKCSKMNPKERAKVSELLEHPFIKRADSLDRMAVMKPLLDTPMDFDLLKKMLAEEIVDEEGDEFAVNTRKTIHNSKTNARQNDNNKSQA